MNLGMLLGSMNLHLRTIFQVVRPQSYNTSSLSPATSTPRSQPPIVHKALSNMSLAKMSKAELTKRIQEYGEDPPTRWNKPELICRLDELMKMRGEDKATLKSQAKGSLKNQITELNKARKKKADLVVYLQEKLGVAAGTNETVDQLTTRGIQAIYSQVAATSQDAVGFGRHSKITYGELLNCYPTYADWVKKTAIEADDPDPRLMRLAAWLNQATDVQMAPQEAPKSKKGYHLNEPVPEPAAIAPPTPSSTASGSQDPAMMQMMTEQQQVMKQLMETVVNLQEQVRDLKDEKPRKKQS